MNIDNTWGKFYTNLTKNRYLHLKHGYITKSNNRGTADTLEPLESNSSKETYGMISQISMESWLGC